MLCYYENQIEYVKKRSGRILGISEMTTFKSFQLFIKQINPWVQDVDTQNLLRPIAHLSISEHI